MGGSGSKLRESRVVIIGGGYGGMAVAMELKSKCKLTLIDPKDHFFHNIGSLRACVEPDYTDNIFIPYAPSLGDAFLQGHAKSLDIKTKRVILDSGKSLTYDYLVLATGSNGPFPGKLDRMAPVMEIGLTSEMYKLTLEKIKSANKIVIIGGGAVGVELAGEISTEFPGKDITLIQGPKRGLIEGKELSTKFRKNVLEQLHKLKVNVLIGVRAVNVEDLPKDGYGKCKVKTDDGKQIDADLWFNCTGLRTNSGVYTDQLDDKMDDNDRLRVNNFLQVQGLTDIYAVGDCCNADGLRMAYTAGLQAKVVAQNIPLGVAGKNYKSYKSGGTSMVVTIGRHGGVAQIGSNVMGSFVVKKMKSRDLFVNKYWKEWKQVPPLRRGATIKNRRTTRKNTTPPATATGKKQPKNQPPAAGKPGIVKDTVSQPSQRGAAAKTAPPTSKAPQRSQSNQHKTSGTKQAAPNRNKSGKK